MQRIMNIGRPASRVTSGISLGIAAGLLTLPMYMLTGLSLLGPIVTAVAVAFSVMVVAPLVSRRYASAAT